MLAPNLQFVAEVIVEVATPITIAQTEQGLRRMVPILGGTIRGPSVSATILAAGEDTQLIRPDGYTFLDARYAARLDSGGFLYIANRGVRYGAPEVMARITRGEPVDPKDVYFRTVPRFETDAPDYLWMTRPLFIGTGARHPGTVELKVYSVE